jgi:RNA polymerase sigma factor (sigma-70 family)
MATSQRTILEPLRRAVLLRDGAGLTDGQLLECFLSRGDEDAFAALVRRHGPMVWGVCRRVLRSHHHAEDAFQATFLVLVRKAPSVVPREMVANWLYGVARQTALKERALASRRGERERPAAEMPEPAVEEQGLSREAQSLIDDELSRLPEKYRAPVVLCDLEGKTRKEDARQLGWPEGTVAGRLARARTLLATRLSRRGLALPVAALAAVSAPTSAVSNTIRVASLFAGAQAATGEISASVAALTEGVLKAMSLNRRIAWGAVLLAVLLLGGAGALAHRAPATAKDERPNAEPKGRTKALVTEDWPRWLGPRGDSVWRETGILTKFPKGGPKILWRVPIGGGYTGPAVTGGHVYVMDRQLPKDTKPEEFPRNRRKGQPGTERILCLDQANGAVLWKHEYDCPYRISYSWGPRTTPIVQEGKVWALGAMGDLYCLDAAAGKVLWSKNLMKDYGLADPPLWGFSAHPLLDGDRLICLVGGEGSAVIAFHKDTGKELWKALTTQEIGYAAPTICEAGGKRQLIAFLADSVNSLDPETGKVYWTEKYPAEGSATLPAVTVATPRVLGDLLFVSGSYDGPQMLRLTADKPGAKVLWRGKNKSIYFPGPHLHCLNTTPVLVDGYLYGVGNIGDLMCVKAETGEKVWETYKAIDGRPGGCGTAFLVRQADRFFLFNDRGDLIIARLTPKGYEEIDRTHLLDPTGMGKGRKVVWSHPAFASRCGFVRNDKEILCVSLAEAE